MAYTASLSSDDPMKAAIMDGHELEPGRGALARLAAAVANACKLAAAAMCRRTGAMAGKPAASAPKTYGGLKSDWLSELPRGQGQAVMIVKDDPALVVLAEEMLARLGYRPCGFTSGAAALEAFHLDPAYYDAALVDEAVSDVAARMLVDELRRRRSDIPILLISSCKEEQLTERARAASVNAVLRKPFLTHEIAAPIAQLLAERRR